MRMTPYGSPPFLCSLFLGWLTSMLANTVVQISKPSPLVVFTTSNNPIIEHKTHAMKTRYTKVLPELPAENYPISSAEIGKQKWFWLFEQANSSLMPSSIISFFIFIFRWMWMVQAASITWFNRISRFSRGFGLLHGVMFHAIKTCILQASENVRLVQAHSSRHQLRWLPGWCDAVAILFRQMFEPIQNADILQRDASPSRHESASQREGLIIDEYIDNARSMVERLPKSFGIAIEFGQFEVVNIVTTVGPVGMLNFR